MGLVQRTLPALFNGVSRQPALLRSSDQTESELNTWSSLSSGLGKRPTTTHIAKLMNTLAADAFIHSINRSSDERYFVIIAGGTIKVFGLDGIERTVNAPGGTGYLTGSSFAAVTVADYTFIVNRDTAVTLKAVAADEAAAAAYLRYAPRQLYGDVDYTYGAGDVISGSALQYGPNPTSAALTGTVGSMDDLPAAPPDGVIYRVKGNDGIGFLDYYVRRNGGVWDETVAPAIRNSLDETTLPHALVREADGTFTFAPFSWAPRRVGDETTNPAPTFAGRSIRDVAFYQNRLVFLVDESVVMSCAGDFGNFFRTTVLDLIDSDPVDVAVTTANVAVLDFITLFNDGALLFADQTQFSLSNAENGVTPSSVAIRPITRYPLSRRARPVVVGTEVYFSGHNAGYSVLYEYTRQSDADGTSAAEITAHVPGLIPPDLAQLVAIPRGILGLTGGPTVYCYQLYWNGNEKVLSAWRPWEATGDVMAAASVDSVIFLIVREADGIYLEQIELADGATPATQDWPVYLERRFQVTGVEASGSTTFTLPYAVPVELREDFRLIGGNNGSFSYSVIDLSGATWASETSLVVPKVSLGTSTGGFAMDFHVELSRQFQVTPQGIPLTTGRLLMRQFTVNFTQTSSFTAEVWPYGRPAHPSIASTFPHKVSSFTGTTLGGGSAVLGQAPVADGSHSFTVTGDAAKVAILLSDRNHGGATFSSAEWEGFYNRRG